VSSATVGQARSDHLSLPTVFAFVSATIPGAILLGMLGVYLPRYFAVLGLPLFTVGATFSLVRVVDTLTVDLPLGWGMDHTRSPLGRYKPWFLLGAPILMVGVYMLFNPPHPIHREYLFVWYLILWVGLSTMTISHSAWAANLATNYNERSRLFGWMIPVGVIGGIGLNLLPLFTHGRIGPGIPSSVPLIGWAVIVIGTITTAIAVLGVREPVAPSAHRGKVVWRDYWTIVSRPTSLRLVSGDLLFTLGPGLTGPIYIFFFNQVKGFPVNATSVLLTFYTAAGLVFAPIWAAVARRVGKHQTLQIACVCYAIFQTSLMAIPRTLFFPTAALMFLVGGSASAFLFLVRAMLADFSDELRLEQGVARVSLLYSFVGMTQKLGTSLNAFITFSILAWVGFNPGEHAHNTPRAIFGLEMTYLFAPIIFVALGGVMFVGYRLDAKRHAQIREALEARDAAIEEGALVEGLTGESTLAAAE
jgi:GPH family glycoside/pentoside/hexuronide:cation symporter